MNVVGGETKPEGHCWRSMIQPAHSSTRSNSERCSHSSRVTCREWATSCSKSRVRREETSELSTAKLISSLMPNERLSRLVEPTTLQRPSMTGILAGLREESYSYIS